MARQRADEDTAVQHNTYGPHLKSLVTFQLPNAAGRIDNQRGGSLTQSSGPLAALVIAPRGADELAQPVQVMP